MHHIDTAPPFQLTLAFAVPAACLVAAIVLDEEIQVVFR